MNQIKAKLGTIMVLLLVVVMFIPAATSKYVTSGKVTGITLNTSLIPPWYGIVYTDAKGTSGPTMTFKTTDNDVNEDGTNDNSLTSTSTYYNIKLPYSGYYFICAKGGNGGAGLNVSKPGTGSGLVGVLVGSYEPVSGGYGGIVSGVVKIDDFEKERLLISIATSGKDATAATGSNSSVSERSSLYGRSSFDTNVGRGGEGAATNYSGMRYPYNSGGGGGTTVVALDKEGPQSISGVSGGMWSPRKDDIILLAGGGGSSASRWNENVDRDCIGGDGGTNYNDAASCGDAYAQYNNVNKGKVYAGTAGGTNQSGYGGGGGTTSGGSGGTGDGNTGGTHTTASGSTAFTYTGGTGGAAVASTYNYAGCSGAGGGGFAGGGSGGSDRVKTGGSTFNPTYGYYLGAGGGGSSFVSDTMSTVANDKYQEYVNSAMALYDSTYTVNTTNGRLQYNGTYTSLSYVIIYYIGTSL